MNSIWKIVTFGSCSWVKNLTAKNLILLRRGYCGGLLPSLFYLFKPDHDIKFKKYRYRVKFWVLSNPW